MINTWKYYRCNYSLKAIKKIKIGDIVISRINGKQLSEIVTSVNLTKNEFWITTDLRKYYITKFNNGYGLYLLKPEVFKLI